MAVEVRVFSATVPAGTAVTSPQTTQIRFPARTVEAIEVQFPPGPRGEVGLRIGAAGVQLIPFDLGSWFIADNEVKRWALEEQHDSGSWEMTLYNTGTYDHTITARFELGLIQRQVQGTASIPQDQLGSVPGTGPLDQLPPLPPLPPLPGGSLPTLPTLIPPITPTLPLPGQSFTSEQWTRRPERELVASYGGQLHTFWVTPQGQLEHGRAGRGWTVEALSWAGGLVPSGWLAGARFGGLVHVFAPLQAGGILHLAQPEGGGGADSWGGEVLGGA